MVTLDKLLWVEKYRPRKIADCIIPKKNKSILEGYVKNRSSQNLILASTAPGTGKTSAARAIASELGYDTLFINASLENGIDVLRTKIQSFCSSVSMTGDMKCVVMDEADFLNCLSADEKVLLSNGNTVALGDLESGKTYDVVSFNAETKKFENDTAKVLKSDKKDVFSIELEDGTTLKCTEDHPIAVKDADGNISFRTIKDGLDGYEILKCVNTIDYTSCKIKKITPVGTKQVVDLFVEKNHTFVTANGVIVHNCNSIQPALRAFIERFSSNVRFIFTCNYINKLIDPIVSRCTVIDFNIPPEERNDIAKQITARCCDILRAEGVEFDVKAVVKVISLYFPDFRRVLNELQRYAVGGTIDMGILTGLNQGKYDTLLKAVGTKNFKVMREWVGNNKDVDTQRLFTWMFNHAEEFLIPQSVPELILILADYQHRAAFVADQEINLSAALTEMMMKLKFKE